MLTDTELEVVATKSGFVRAFPDETMTLMTTRTPEFLGLRKGSGFWSDAGYGKGVIIGLVDTGIDATHPSFDDHGVSPPPARWKGSCKAARCNNKLIGAKSLVGGDCRDDFGHGTHTSATAAGNFVTGASAYDVRAGTAAGIAPGAHIAMYKMGDSTDMSVVLAGLDAAIKDGVDVISLSLGMDKSYKFDLNPIAIGAFSAVSKGIIVVCSAGNKGPEMGSVENDAPWFLTVGAGSVDRSFGAGVHLANGRHIDGDALNQVGKFDSKPHPLLYTDEGRYCEYKDDHTITGKIVVCEINDDIDTQEPSIIDIIGAGAAGVVLANDKTSGYSTILRGEYNSSVVQVSAADGGVLKAYVESASSSMATLTYNNTLLGVGPAPVVAWFSSRGPSSISPGVLKPDILAPGLNILAAWPTNLINAPGPFEIQSGTSMASPHVSGVAALIKSSHPDWSPAAIKSAIMTTSDAHDNTGGPIMDEQHRRAPAYATGAGHVNPTQANDPGLVFDLGVADYAGYICELLGDHALSVIVRNSSMTCKNLPKISEVQLNYPTITVPMKPTPFAVSRTVTNVGPAESTYKAKVDAPKSLTVRISPETLIFSKVGEKKTFSVSVSSHGMEGHKRFVEASLRWVSEKHIVRSPIVVVANLGRSPPKHWTV
jgi:subtilisin family serine protease